jgi:two-component system CheB/CheR fusion protein
MEAQGQTVIDDHKLMGALPQFYRDGITGMAFARYNGDIVHANQSFLNLFGYTEADLVLGGMNWRKMTPPEFLPASKVINALKVQGNSPILIKEYFHKTGKRIAVLISSTVIDSPYADVVNCVFDVTDQEVLKDQLKLVAAKYRSIWNSSIIGIYTWHVDGLILDANDAYCHILGYSQDDIRAGNIKWTGLIEPGHTAHLQGIEKVKMGLPVVPYETRHRHKDGTFRTIMIGYEMLPGSVTEGICMLIDITGQKELQDKLNKTNERITKITEHMVDVISIHDNQLRYVYASPAISNYFGKPAQTLIGKTCRDMELPEHICRLYDQYIKQVFEQKENITIAYALNDSVYLQSVLTPEFNKAGEVETVLIVSRDITRLKQEEQKKDSFISLVGHEMKTPVTGLKIMIQLAQRNLAKGNTNEASRLMNKAESLLNKQISIIDNLMELSRVDTDRLKLSYEKFALLALINDCVEMVSVHHNPALIYVDCAPDIYLQADRNRMEQVICNIVANASRYSSSLSPIYIAVSTLGSNCTIAIIDEGIGIAPEKLPHIFKRLYRVNDEGHSSSGLGLGLYISAQIVNLHKGTIRVESTPGKGSTFYIQVPLLNP